MKTMSLFARLGAIRLLKFIFVWIVHLLATTDVSYWIFYLQKYGLDLSNVVNPIISNPKTQHKSIDESYKSSPNGSFLIRLPTCHITNIFYQFFVFVGPVMPGYRAWRKTHQFMASSSPSASWSWIFQQTTYISVIKRGLLENVPHL